MRSKAIVFWVAAIIAFVVVHMLLRGRVSEPVAMGFGFWAMWLVGYPTQQYLRGGTNVPFLPHALTGALGALVGGVIFYFLD